MHVKRAPRRDPKTNLWTAFGPTNVAIHRVATAMELGDVQVAIDLGPQIDTSVLPTERRVRHALETAPALSTSNRRDEALATVCSALSAWSPSRSGTTSLAGSSSCRG